MHLSLLTFNTLGTPYFAPDITRRYKKAAEIINNSDHDIVTLQELFSHYNRVLFDRGLTNFPYRIRKLNPLGVYGGLVIYSKLPLEFIRFHTYTYTKGMNIPFYTRLAQSGVLVARLKNEQLSLVTTHLSTDTVHNLTPANRYFNLIKNQVLQASDIMSKEAKTGNSVLLTGDFNISKGSMLYKEFVNVTGAHDLFERDETPTYSPDRIAYPFPGEQADRIDYIFFKQEKLKITSKKTNLFLQEPEKLSNGKTSYLSDHVGLSTKIVLT